MDFMQWPKLSISNGSAPMKNFVGGGVTSNSTMQS
jgi:hypothetical protein